MSTSINSTHHSGRQRGARRSRPAVENAPQDRPGMTGAPGLATLLSSALAAAAMVVAYQVMDSVAEGHLLVMWMVLWASAFAALVLCAGAARTLAMRMKTGADDWSRSSSKAGAGQRTGAIRRADAGMMTGRQGAAGRSASAVQAYREVVKPQLKTMSARARRLARFS